MKSRAASSALSAVLMVLWAASSVLAQAPQRQTQEDDYTRYELLGPDTAQFRILYEVTATTAGAPFFFNAIRRGSVATDERVTDMMTGQPLKWEVVSGTQARAEGHPTADLETEWLKVHLARPVPKGGAAGGLSADQLQCALAVARADTRRQRLITSIPLTPGPVQRDYRPRLPRAPA